MQLYLQTGFLLETRYVCNIRMFPIIYIKLQINSFTIHIILRFLLRDMDQENPQRPSSHLLTMSYVFLHCTFDLIAPPISF